MSVDFAQILAQVDWFYVVVLALLAFVATLIGNVLAFSSRIFAAVLSAVVFACFFVALTYYPHHLPLLPTAPAGQKAAAPAPAPVAQPPQTPAQRRPANPIQDITPPPPAGTPTPAR